MGQVGMLKQPTGDTVRSEYITTSVHSVARQARGHQMYTNGRLICVAQNFGIVLLPKNILAKKIHGLAVDSNLHNKSIRVG